MSTIGFFGLGVMGAPMAGHLPDAGHRLLTVRLRLVPHPRGARRTHAHSPLRSGHPHPPAPEDLELAREAACELGLGLPNTASTQQLFNLCIAHGGGEWHRSALVHALELGAGMDVDGKPQAAADS